MTVDPKRPVPEQSVPHTPGPWTTERFEVGQHKYCQRTVVLAGEFGAVCELHYSDSGYLGDPRADERKASQLANATLIAAAPDLLATLRQLAEWGDEYSPFVSAAAREAIAKATGGVA